MKFGIWKKNKKVGLRFFLLIFQDGSGYDSLRYLANIGCGCLPDLAMKTGVIRLEKKLKILKTFFKSF